MSSCREGCKGSEVATVSTEGSWLFPLGFCCRVSPVAPEA